MKTKKYSVYIMTNKNHTTLYTEISGDLQKRIKQHKEGKIPGFTKKYNIDKLVFYEHFSNPKDAISAEKKIKSGSRKKKENLIEGMNPNWEDLFKN